MKGVGDDGEVAGKNLLEPLLFGKDGLVETYLVDNTLYSGDASEENSVVIKESIDSGENLR